jgi:hypothetical protein
MAASPVNKILQEWHFDPDFSDGAGNARALPFEGPGSFSTLVSTYVRDIPPGAMRSTLQNAGLVTQNSDGLLSVSQPFFYPNTFDEDSIRVYAFTMSNLGSTIAHNAALHQRTELPYEKKRELVRMERSVWSEYLSEEGIARLKAWVNFAVPPFLEDANHVIGEAEIPRNERDKKAPRAVGVGIYYFEED